MAKAVAIVITGIAIVLLMIYGADVAASANVDGEKGDGLLPLDDMQRGIGLGVPAIILTNNCIFHIIKRTIKRIRWNDNHFRCIDTSWWNRISRNPCTRGCRKKILQCYLFQELFRLH